MLDVYEIKCKYTVLIHIPENTLVFELLGKKIGSKGEETDAPAPALDVNKTEFSLVGELVHLKEGGEGTSTSNIITHNGTDNQNKTRHTSLGSQFDFIPPPPIPAQGKLRESLLSHVRNFSSCPECRKFALEHYQNDQTRLQREEIKEGVNFFQLYRAEPMQYVVNDNGGTSSPYLRRVWLLLIKILILILF